MRHTFKPGLAAFLAGWATAGVLATAPPARAAHLSAVVDARGRKVYVNLPERPFRSRLKPGASSFTPSLGSPEISSFVERAADRFQLDPHLVHAIIRVESDYDPRAVSPKGAMGLMQLIPATARRFGVANPFDPQQNIEGGVTYLNYLLNLFRGDVPLSLAAYNAGENSVVRARGIPPIRETERYVAQVTSLYHGGTHLERSVALMPARGARKRHAPGRRPAAMRPVASAAPVYSYVDRGGVVHFEQ